MRNGEKNPEPGPSVSEAFCKAGVVFCIGALIVLAALGLSYVA